MDVTRKVVTLARECGANVEVRDINTENLIPEPLREGLSMPEVVDRLAQVWAGCWGKVEGRSGAAGSAARFLDPSRGGTRQGQASDQACGWGGVFAAPVPRVFSGDEVVQVARFMEVLNVAPFECGGVWMALLQAALFAIMMHAPHSCGPVLLALLFRVRAVRPSDAAPAA